jgi:hypothetical protein
MRRFGARTVAAAAMALVLARAPEAAAQPAMAPAGRTGPLAAEVAAQASFDTGYLLALYMAQLAAAGSAPSQADIDEAAQQYFTHGAAATAVPSEGPGAAYFHAGAEVTSVPNSGPGAAYFHDGAEVLAYSGAPATPPAPAAPVEEGAEEGPTGPRVAETVTALASTPLATAPPAVGEGAPAPEVSTVANAGGGLTCSPREIEAAMAIAAQFAVASAQASASASEQAPPSPCVPSPGPAPVCPRSSPTPAAEPGPRCAPGPSFVARIGPAMVGALLGALAAALWLRPRPPRAPQRRSPVGGRA